MLPLPSRSEQRGINPWLIAVLVAFASFMENLDTAFKAASMPSRKSATGLSDQP
jgi:hypothetical protein